MDGIDSKRLASTSTKLPPCCLRIHPDNTSWIFFGTYKLEDDKTRHGSVEIFHYDQEQQSLELAKSYATDGAILDMKFCPFDSSILATAHSTGNLILWKVQLSESQETASLEVLQDAQLFERDVLITSLHFSPLENNLILLTLTSGEVVTTRITNSTLSQPEIFAGTHDEECWTGSFGAQGALSQVIFTGGDDAALIAHDLRDSSSMPIFKSNRLHEAGVVSILNSTQGNTKYISEWNTSQEYDIWTGSYDDNIRSLDLRVGFPTELIPGMPPRVKNKLNLGGGVWRLIPSPLPNDDRVLSCCMYDGARILSTDAKSDFKIERYFKQDHMSMCYGGDWSSDGKFIATCSFYDTVVQIWSPDEKDSK